MWVLVPGSQEQGGRAKARGPDDARPPHPLTAPALGPRSPDGERGPLSRAPGVLQPLDGCWVLCGPGAQRPEGCPGEAGRDKALCGTAASCAWRPRGSAGRDRAPLEGLESSHRDDLSMESLVVSQARRTQESGSCHGLPRGLPVLLALHDPPCGGTRSRPLLHPLAHLARPAGPRWPRWPAAPGHSGSTGCGWHFCPPPHRSLPPPGACPGRGKQGWQVQCGHSAKGHLERVSVPATDVGPRAEGPARGRAGHRRGPPAGGVGFTPPPPTACHLVALPPSLAHFGPPLRTSPVLACGSRELWPEGPGLGADPGRPSRSHGDCWKPPEDPSLVQAPHMGLVAAAGTSLRLQGGGWHLSQGE